MKFVEFNYTKANGTASKRAVIELLAPQEHFEGIDVSQMPEDNFAEFISAYRELKNQQHEATMKLLAEYDLKNNYRRFIPEKMTEVVSEYI
jgi:alpha-ketoglutarate-dependent taurine dioxygenase